MQPERGWLAALCLLNICMPGMLGLQQQVYSLQGTASAFRTAAFSASATACYHKCSRKGNPAATSPLTQVHAFSAQLISGLQATVLVASAMCHRVPCATSLTWIP